MICSLRCMMGRCCHAILREGWRQCVAAVHRGACAIMGFVGTAVGRSAIARLGLLRAGMLATSLQGTLLFGAWLVHR